METVAQLGSFRTKGGTIPTTLQPHDKSTPFEALSGYPPPQLSVTPDLDSTVQPAEDWVMKKQMQQLLRLGIE